ncbi:M48 family metallopeptidase [Pseudothioclava nitratireducens]|uniref:M48 family metallopeptidase n=1 Tax=Pseudothioclava nitratireducens TaxID=1928646 RepID=UPI0023DB9F1B|nr:M48 family metallopeptidase [Defluviimonas nitratireducens]MDF1618971.1 M48 family metallopeptidase [Defluviimonas nitratireducens]
MLQATIPMLRAPKGLLGAALLLVLLAGCEAPVMRPAPIAPQAEASDALPSPTQQAANFVRVAGAMEPQIEAECLARTRGRNCDYQIVVDDRPGQPANAFQTEDRSGRPIVGFTLALIAEARNEDELAFVMGHEAAHHIAGHLQSKTQDAYTGAAILGVLAAAYGADARGISEAQNIGAAVGSRAYSKDYELEADRLGTIITWNAGFDPLRGAEFFTRIPDPGQTFLGTHPANGLRIDEVRRTVAELRAGRL